MKENKCAIVQDLLPMYIENITSAESACFIEEHLNNCECCNIFHKKMKVGIEVKTTEVIPDKKILHYINWIKIWYMLCPLLMLLFIILGWNDVLRIYEIILGLISLSCIGSEIFHKSSWWDPECMELQDVIRNEEKKKRGNFYVRPFLIGLPAILVIIVFRLPQILHYVSMLI